jgi:hypothetical protein
MKDKEFYRYEDCTTRTMRPLFGADSIFTRNAPELIVYKVVKETEKRYGIQEKNWHDIIWIPKHYVKRPKYRETEAEALHDYICRKKKQLKILKNYIDRTSQRLRTAQGMADGGERFCEFPNEKAFPYGQSGCQHLKTQEDKCLLYDKKVETEGGWRKCCEGCKLPFYVKDKENESLRI